MSALVLHCRYNKLPQSGLLYKASQNSKTDLMELKERRRQGCFFLHRTEVRVPQPTEVQSEPGKSPDVASLGALCLLPVPSFPGRNQRWHLSGSCALVPCTCGAMWGHNDTPTLDTH